MKNKQAFTLIELLVVVLIIGILAAVAVPQYQKAVEKSKAAQALTLLKTLSQATQNYYLANGTYPTKFDELAVDIPWTGTQPWRIENSLVRDTLSNNEWSVQIYNDDTSFRLWMGRISGAYAGAGFTWSSARGVECVEDFYASNTHPFSLSLGSYCEKLFKGQRRSNGQTYYFTLP